MNGMLAAIKNKRKGQEGDHQDMGHGSQHADDKEKDLHGFVESLNDHEKGKLKSILAQDGNAQGIAQGDPSTEERGKIQDAMGKENQMNALEEQDEPVDSDAIGKSMLDSKYMGSNPPTDKPRNLGERVKMGIAAKLKSKGKIQNMDVNTENTAAPAVETQVEAPVVENQPTDLDGLSEFTYQGEKYTPDALAKIFGEHKTYSQSHKEHQSEKKFSDNFQIDLESVLERPDLASKFKATYPQKYHAILDMFLRVNNANPAQTNNAQSSLPKEFMSDFEQMKERIQFHERRAYEAEVQSANAKLDSILPPLFDKYKMANEDQVYGRAEALIQSGQKLTDKTWERLVRESDEKMQKKADQVYSARLKSQMDKGQRGSDVGPGGATPGQAPVKLKTFAEAQEAMIAHYKQKGL